jgi:hypothetical protein
MAVTGALGTALALAAPLAASADTKISSYAQGQLLSGTIAGTNLDNVAELTPATASNDGTQPTQTSKDPLSATVLSAATINAPNGVNENLGDYADVGGVSQFAMAAKDGTSMASSGVLGNNGAIDTAGDNGQNGSGSVTLDLDKLLGNKFAAVLTDLTLQAQDVAAQANAQGSTASGDYTLNGLTLNFTSPAIANLGQKVDAALAPAEAQIGALDGSTGNLSDAVNSVVNKISPILNLVGANASVNANIDANLQDAVAPLLDGTYGNGAVTFDLSTGKVSVDLAKLEGGDLNNEPVGTEVLSDAVVNKILNSITSTVSTLGDQIVAKATTAITDAPVTIDATVNANTAQAPLLGQVCAPSSGGTSSGGGLLGGLGGLGGLLNSGGGIVGQLLCTPTSTALPSLNTSLNVHVAGTVGGLTSGDPTAAAATLNLLGVPTTVNVNTILGGIDGALTDNLLDSNSAVSNLTSGVQQNLVLPAVDGLLDANGTSVDSALTKGISVTLNNQDLSTANGGTLFTQNALRVAALPGSGAGGLLTLDLADATVGPNVTTVVPTNPTDPGNPSNPGDPGNPSTPGSPSIPTAFGNLAFTGIGIAGLVSAILALLAAGAYLVREGYRRNSRRQIQ